MDISLLLRVCRLDRVRAASQPGKREQTNRFSGSGALITRTPPSMRQKAGKGFIYVIYMNKYRQCVISGIHRFSEKRAGANDFPFRWIAVEPVCGDRAPVLIVLNMQTVGLSTECLVIQEEQNVSEISINAGY
jgi:hypothetical protein